MMLRKSLFALSAVLLLGATAACGEDDPGDGNNNNNNDVSCEEDPSQDKCQTSSDPCVQDPSQDICKRDDARDDLAYSYVNGLVIPDESAPCCWDYTADNNNDADEFDNALGNILGIPMLDDLLGDKNLNEILGDLFEENTLTLLLEYKDLPKELTLNGALDIALHLGESESEWADRNSGNGVFALGDKLAGITGFTRRGTISAQSDDFPLALDLTGFVDASELENLGLPDEIKISLSKVRLAIKAIEDQDNKISNDVSVTEDGGKSTNFLTGLIAGKELAKVLNDVVGRGLCKETINGDVITFSEDVDVDPDDVADGILGKPVIEVVDKDALADCFDDAGLDIDFDIAGIIPVVGSFFDVDSNGNGVADGLSLGLFLSVAGAEIE